LGSGFRFVLKAQSVLAQNEILGFKLFEINRVPRARSVINLSGYDQNHD
jgi:hypothetical protein